jgi:hypothetical protein
MKHEDGTLVERILTKADKILGETNSPSVILSTIKSPVTCLGLKPGFQVKGWGQNTKIHGKTIYYVL